MVTRMASLLAWASLLALDVASGAASDELVTDYATCKLQNYNDRELMAVYTRNCGNSPGATGADRGKVFRAIQEFGKQQNYTYVSQAEDWRRRGDEAKRLCEQAGQAIYAGNQEQGAMIAVQAWGGAIMNNKQCCTLLEPPFCLIPSHSNNFSPRSPVGYFFAAIVLLVPLMWIASCWESYRDRRSEAAEAADEQKKSRQHVEKARADAEALPAPAQESKDLALELQNVWLRESCLRAMPGRHRLAASAGIIFSFLQKAFDLQEDSVRNQFEHFISLIRSHVSMIADRKIDEDGHYPKHEASGGKFDDGTLLMEALDELHGELLEGFLSWRAKMDEPDDESAMPPCGGINWGARGALIDGSGGFCERSKQLAEIAAYLCVWGEAGNVRFMPECIYFLAEMMLQAGPPADPAKGFYGLNPVGLRRKDLPLEAYRSNLFLSQIIRPIYGLVFDAWYSDVEVANGKDKKNLRKRFLRYLAPDVANYDDWNEFFCNPAQLKDKLLLKSGDALYDLEKQERFGKLYTVEWAASLNSTDVKTHRECHSMWGVFAATHRVWLLHALMFFLGLCTVTGDPVVSAGPDTMEAGEIPLGGASAKVRFAAVGLLAPVHALLWGYARFETTSTSHHKRSLTLKCGMKGIIWAAIYFAPLCTYAYARILERDVLVEGASQGSLLGVLFVHYALSGVGLGSLLLNPAREMDRLFPVTPVPVRVRVIRYLFWGIIVCIKFLLGLVVTQAVWVQTKNLDFVLIGRQSGQDLEVAWRTSSWGAEVLEWALLWGTTFFLYCADTAMWFQIGCCFLGAGTVFVQRDCAVFQFAFEDAIAKLPTLLSRKVLPFAPGADSTAFPKIWDKIVKYMREENVCDDQGVGQLSYGQRQKTPLIFTKTTACELCLQNYCKVGRLPPNPVLQWRLFALARGMGLKIPKPFRAPYIPGITVLIPHYGETIIMTKDELFDAAEDEGDRPLRFGGCELPVKRVVPLIEWLKCRYPQDFNAFEYKMQQEIDSHWPLGAPWDAYSDEHWKKICVWASMRMQTLWRTVQGMCLYDDALKTHFEMQGIEKSNLSKDTRGQPIWSAGDCFTCMVTMQMYKTFNQVQLQQTNQMFAEMPSSLKVAFIDWDDLTVKDNPGLSERLASVAHADGVSAKQERRYHSCLIDSTSRKDGERRVPHFRIELPGFPILGDGKGDNQNHAIPFMRGVFSQCIDANQGAYFEQMLLLPCVLGEYRTKKKGSNKAKQIIGLPEHITSDIGSIGDFAAGSEVAFGTISQRSFAVLGGRMHYGHPDIMSKQYMMQQGGVSKATKTLNLSEDIFAGMDFTLRGQGRTIKHCEYFHIAKGRDLGFNAVLGFFSKLSGGTGEQVLTRQMLRLGNCMQLPECLTFYYAHSGYYFTQVFVSWAMPLLVFTWLLILTADCETEFKAFMSCPEVSAAESMAATLSTWFSSVMLIFLVATSMPLFIEMWMQRNFCFAVVRFVKQLATGSFLMFIFQAKVIGYYIMNELRYGGAGYVATGRGLPTERRSFVGQPARGSFKLTLAFKNVSFSFDSLDEQPQKKNQIKEAVHGAIVTATGESLLQPHDFELEVMDARHLIVTIETPRKMQKTIEFGAKLSSDKVRDQILAHLRRLPQLESAIITAREVDAESEWRIEKVEGLYLDWAMHTYYDGMTLLFGTISVLIAGGYSEAGDNPKLGFTFFSIFLTIASWLYAPFFFNPYQFTFSYILDDAKALYGLYVTDGGAKWKEWYVAKQLKPLRGLGKMIGKDVNFLLSCFMLAVWISMLSLKLTTLTTIYSEYRYMKWLYPVMLVPPVFSAFVYCLVVPLIEKCLVHGEGRRRSRLPVSDSEDSGSSSDSAPEAGHARTLRDGESCKSIPLVVSALVVVAVEFLEAVVLLNAFCPWGWTKTKLAGVILKYIWFLFILSIAKSALSMKKFCDRLEKTLPTVRRVVELWVFSNEMFRDWFISLFIFLTMQPWVLLTVVNDMCLPNLNWHQAFVYRATGQEPRQGKIEADETDSDSDATPLRGTVRPPATTFAPAPGGSVTLLGGPPPLGGGTAAGTTAMLRPPGSQLPTRTMPSGTS